MMQVPSSNQISTPPRLSSSGPSPRASLLRFLDQATGFMDKNFCCSPVYQSSQLSSEEDDDNTIDYNHGGGGGDERHQQQRNAASDDTNSVLWDAADDSIQWLVESRQQRHQVYQREFEQARTPSRRGSSSSQATTTIHKQARSPAASDATATTILTDNTRTTVGSFDLQSPSSPTNKQPAETTTTKEGIRAHSTGAMRDPEKEYEAAAALAERPQRPSEIYFPTKWGNSDGRVNFRRVHSETCSRIPFRSSETKQKQKQPRQQHQ